MNDKPHLFHVLFYDYVEDVVARRDPYRAEHLAGIAAAREAGQIVMAGPVGDPPIGAVLVFDAAVPLEVLDEFVESDPYVKSGIVKRWRIEPWNVLP